MTLYDVLYYLFRQLRRAQKIADHHWYHTLADDSIMRNNERTNGWYRAERVLIPKLELEGAEIDEGRFERQMGREFAIEGIRRVPWLRNGPEPPIVRHLNKLHAQGYTEQFVRELQKKGVQLPQEVLNGIELVDEQENQDRTDDPVKEVLEKLNQRLDSEMNDIIHWMDKVGPVIGRYQSEYETIRNEVIAQARQLRRRGVEPEAIHLGDREVRVVQGYVSYWPGCEREVVHLDSEMKWMGVPVVQTKKDSECSVKANGDGNGP